MAVAAGWKGPRATRRVTQSHTGGVSLPRKTVTAPPRVVSVDFRQRCIKRFEGIKVDKSLGLDINLTSSGWALVDENGAHLKSGTFDLSKTPDLYDKAQLLEKNVLQVMEESQTKKKKENLIIGVEDFVRAFGGQSWRTVDIMRLAQLNSIISYSIFTKTGNRPTKFYPASYRSFFGLNKAKGKTKNIKMVSFDYVSTLLPDYPWTMTRTGTMHKSNYDIVDAFLCAKYALKRYREERLLQEGDLKSEFEAELAKRHTALVQQGGDEWKEKIEESWLKEVRAVSDVVFPKVVSPGSDSKSTDDDDDDE